MNKHLKFLINPKKSIQNSIEKKATLLFKERIDKFTKHHFLIPINDCKENDVFIVGFPKSGNTWMQSIVSCLKYGIDPNFLPESLAQELVPDVYAKQYYKRYGPIMAFKSHDLPKENLKRVIYLIRDGRDAIASYYAMYKTMGVDIDLKRMIIDGEKLYPCKWHTHISAWKENPFKSEIQIIKYENLVNNPLNELQKICQFLMLEHDLQFLEKVVEGNRFEKIKLRAKTMGTAHKFFDQHAEGSKFFRKGKVGSYKEELPNELLNYFEQESYKELLEFGYIK